MHGSEENPRETWVAFDPDGTGRISATPLPEAILPSVRTIDIPPRFGPTEVPAWIAAWSSACEAPELRLVLEGSARLEPAAIVLLAAGIARRRALGLRTWMSSTAGDAFAFLASVDFHRELGVEPEAPTFAGRGRATSHVAVPLRRIASLAVAREQADATRALLESLVPAVPPSTVRAAQFVFEELAANIVQHSGASETGFGLAIADPEARRIQIAFADAGVGFLASLSSNPEFAGRARDDGDAIRLALDPRVTRPGTGNIGMGLFLLSSLAERVKGNLWIATGSSLLARRATSDGAHSETFSPTAGWRGAFLCLDAPVPGW